MKELKVLPEGAVIFAYVPTEDGMTLENVTPFLERLFTISENLDKEFPKVLQRLEEIEKQQEKIEKRLAELVQNINEMDSKAVSKEEIEEAEERLLEVLGKHGSNPFFYTHELEGALEPR